MHGQASSCSLRTRSLVAHWSGTAQLTVRDLPSSQDWLPRADGRTPRRNSIKFQLPNPSGDWMRRSPSPSPAAWLIQYKAHSTGFRNWNRHWTELPDFADWQRRDIDAGGNRLSSTVNCSTVPTMPQHQSKVRIQSGQHPTYQRCHHIRFSDDKTRSHPAWWAHLRTNVASMAC